MSSIVLCTLFAVFTIIIVCVYTVNLIDHFRHADLPHPFIMMLVVGSAGLLPIIAVCRIPSHGPGMGDMVIPFFTTMLTAGVIWILFRLANWLGNNFSLNYTRRRLIFLAFGLIPSTIEMFLCAANAIPALQ